MHKRRYEVLLPATYNDGRDVMDACMTCFTRTMGDVLERFGAFTWTPQAVHGAWTDSGVRYDDRLFKLTVDVDDNADAQRFIAALKGDLLARFEQIEIYVVSYAVEIQ